MSITNFDELIRMITGYSPVPVSVAGGADGMVVASLKRGHDLGFIGRCFLTGPEDDIRH
jgi:hypothetical protein